jgi:hypothetical protein
MTRLSVLFLAALAQAVPLKLTDPYAVMQRYYQAIGGLDRCKAETTSYSEGTLTINGAGISGTLKEWHHSPDRYRQEVDLTVLRQTSGDDGRHAWEVDANGKVQFKLDPQSLDDRRLSALVARYDHLNPASSVFKLTLGDAELVDGAECYVVRRVNNINSDTTADYFRATDFQLVKTVEIKPDMRQTTTYGDYRDVNGVKHSFEQHVEVQPVSQRQTVKLTSYEVNRPIVDSVFEPPAGTAADFKFARGFSAEDVPFQFIEKLIYLPVTLNGKERSWILDCGAGKSVVDLGYARELGLELSGELTGQGAGSTVGYSFASLPGFSLPGIEFGPQTVVAIDISPLVRRLAGTDVAGVLGYDFLSRFVTRIDYARKTVSFYLPDSFRYSGGGRELPAPLKDNVPTVPAMVDGKYGGQWRLDIGAASTSFHYPFAQQNGLLDRPGVVTMAAGAGGMFRTRLVRFDSAGLAGFTIRHPIVAIPLDAGAGALASSELVGNIGNDILRRFVLYLDYAKQRVIVEKGRDFGREFPQDHSGLGLAFSDSGEVTVAYVADGTPAYEAGFLAGDIVRTVDGKQAQRSGLPALRELLRQKPGTKHTFALRRGNEELRLVLKLRDIY